jgi:hypothetical protein
MFAARGTTLLGLLLHRMVPALGSSPFENAHQRRRRHFLLEYGFEVAVCDLSRRNAVCQPLAKELFHLAPLSFDVESDLIQRFRLHGLRHAL